MSIFDSSGSKSTQVAVQIPRLNLFTMFRLGLFQMGQSMMFILTLGVLNRVMIQELAIPATIVAATLAIPLFVSPSRIWFGQMSDTKSLFGFHRTSYIWVGAAVFALAAFMSLQVVWQLGNVVQANGSWVWTIQTCGWIGLLSLTFALYGMALSASFTAFTALLVDVSQEDNRSKLIGIVWSMLMLGVIVGAILSGVLLENLTIETPLATLQASINRLFIIVPAIAFGLAVLGTVGVEKKYSKYSSRSTLADREDSITLVKALKILTSSRANRVFFSFLVLMTIGFFMQDPVMEPYAGQIFDMPLSESTKLNAYSGVGTLIILGITGFLIVPRLGKRRTAQLGCVLVAICVGLICLSGFTANPTLLKVALFLFGLATGIATTGALSLMLDLTVAEAAGTYTGAWGLGQAMARGIAMVVGGAALDVGRSLFADSMLAYGLVFALEALALVMAVRLLSRVDVAEFRTSAKQSLASVLESELD